MLELKDVSFGVDGKEILKNINLNLDSGKFIAITGPNGSGKSTLARIIMGIEKPTGGRIYFNGQDITDFSIDERARGGIAFGFQQPVRFKGVTVQKLLRLSAGEDIAGEKLCDVLANVGLCANDYIEREVDSSLSGGELKRIEIASVILRKARLTIFDEPEAGIDLWSFNNLINVFNHMRENISGSIIVISHQERILNIADEIVVISDGRVDKVVPHGTPLDTLVVAPACRKI